MLGEWFPNWVTKPASDSHILKKAILGPLSSLWAQGLCIFLMRGPGDLMHCQVWASLCEGRGYVEIWVLSVRRNRACSKKQQVAIGVGLDLESKDLDPALLFPGCVSLDKILVLVSDGCYNKLPQTWLLKTTHFFFSYSSGSQSLKSVMLGINQSASWVAVTRGQRSICILAFSSF